MTDTTNSPTPEGRDHAGRFRPGFSGNPGGARRRSEADRKIEELARAKSADAFDVVADLMTGSDNDRTRLAAALAILERAHGKPGDRLAEPLELPTDAGPAVFARAVLAAAAGGELPPSQAAALMTAATGAVRVIEAGELEARIQALEAAAAAKGGKA